MIGEISSSALVFCEKLNFTLRAKKRLVNSRRDFVKVYVFSKFISVFNRKPRQMQKAKIERLSTESMKVGEDAMLRLIKWRGKAFW